jgi:hypothetical protein
MYMCKFVLDAHTKHNRENAFYRIVTILLEMNTIT